MSWPKALRWYAVALLLASYYLVFEFDPAKQDSPVDPAAQWLIESSPADVIEVDIHNQRGSARFRRVDSRWRVIGGSGATAPSDLVEAIVVSLTSGQEVEVVAAQAQQLDLFGLDRPKARITLVIRGEAEPVTLLLGNRIPTNTAVYGMLRGSPRIYKIGANVDYYQGQLLF